ncbi:MAG TPA: hypothetical protein VHG72_13480 [Polyangia bacterium]|nr:hypothetical protein [Polyangia bacterium]
MTREIIVSILEGEGAEGRGGTFKIPEAREATCFIANPGDLLAIARVVRVELKDHYAALSTAKEERFIFAYDAILGFKLATATQSKERSAGFGGAR